MRRSRNGSGKALLGAAGVGAGIALVNMLRRIRLEDLRGQVVLITGGSRGLGLALAEKFASLECKIAICARDEAELARAEELLRRGGADVLSLTCDVSKQEQVEELIRGIRSRFGRIDVLINNAGLIRVAPVQNMTLKDFEDAMDVMFWGSVYPTLLVIDEMKQRRSGRIAMITSIGGKVSVPHLLPYCCAKFAAVGFAEGLRGELAEYGVKVITIAPGLMRTGSYRNAEFKGRQSSEAAWFSVSASLPGISMGAERAARQIVSAIRRGQSEKILSTQASLLARINSAVPGFIPDILGLVNRLLPAGTEDRESVRTAGQMEAARGDFFRMLTTLGRKAGQRLNEDQTLAY